MDEREDEIREVMEEDQRRGRRPVDTAARKEREKATRDVRDLLRMGYDEKAFIEALIGFGVEDGSERMAAALKLWRVYRSRDRRRE